MLRWTGQACAGSGCRSSGSPASTWSFHSSTGATPFEPRRTEDHTRAGSGSRAHGGPKSIDEGAGAFADREVAAVVDRVERPAKPSAGLLCDPEAGDPIVAAPDQCNGHADLPELISRDARHVYPEQESLVSRTHARQASGQLPAGLHPPGPHQRRATRHRDGAGPPLPDVRSPALGVKPGAQRRDQCRLRRFAMSSRAVALADVCDDGTTQQEQQPDAGEGAGAWLLPVGVTVSRLLARATPRRSSSTWISPTPPPISRTVAPSMPRSVRNDTMARDERLSPRRRYRLATRRANRSLNFSS